MSGGAGEGLLGVSWFAESDDVIKTVSRLGEICEANGWAFERTDRPENA